MAIKVDAQKDRTRFAPTIPFLIIQSNFGEELQVEAGLPSFIVSFEDKSNIHFLTQGHSQSRYVSTETFIRAPKTEFK